MPYWQVHAEQNILEASIFSCVHNSDLLLTLQPENLLIDPGTEGEGPVLKLCDFGFARTLPHKGAPLTDYVATRW
jgi:serine/threonine protein kinase